MGCTSRSIIEIPDYIEEMENVTVFPLGVEPTRARMMGSIRELFIILL